MPEPCLVDDAGGLATEGSGSVSPGLSQQDADERLAKELAELIEKEFRTYGYGGCLWLERGVSAAVIADAINLFCRDREGQEVCPWMHMQWAALPRLVIRFRR